MPKVNIDEIEYHTEDLTENGLAQLSSLQFLEGQMQKVRQEIAVYQTAQVAYAQALKAEIAKAGLQPLQSETASE
jgi:pimeloyl-CoA synthetase